MATSDAMPRRPRRFHRVVPCLLLCAASLGQLFFDVLHQLSIVLGVVWYGTRAAQGQVAQRFSGTGQPTRGEPDADGKAKARRLTSGIKKVHSAEKLIEVLDRTVDGPILNFSHASAAYTQLVTLKRRKGLQQREWDSPVLLRLHARVEDMVLEEQVGARETANIFWSIAQLSGRLSIPTQLLAALVKSVPTKVKGMDEQNLSNTLWACAKLKEVAPGVLEAVPAIVAQIPKRAKDMVPQALSNCIWASAQLKDVAPDVLEAVPAIVMQIPKKAKNMKPQELSNCLWASGQLKDVAPEVLQAVPAIVAQIPDKAPDMIPQELSNCLFACAQLKDEAPEVLEAVPAIVMQIPKKAQKMVPQDLSNNLLACAQLNDDVPEVLDMLPAIVGEIPAKLQGMKPQEMSNSLEALVLLRDSVPEVGGVDDILSSAAERLNTLLPNLRGKDFSFTVPVVVWACAKAEVYHGELLDSVATRLGSRTKLSALPDFGVCALSWSYQDYQVLDSDDDFEDFKALLMSETEKRGFSEADVQSCQHGRSGWNYR
ncbi:unnamed protein product [Cladocopium goreaui]|uniref:Uncharacterized protein n=1 Tax=Cladocopium goreaui TaxID=2562237 RepID=A0A9P1FSL4_9DINO|nr:unnamed protein product [Cladocopium goreaui]